MKHAPTRTLTPTGFGLILAGALGVLLLVFHRDLLHSIRAPALLITEIMAVNHSSLADADGEYPGWVEIHNPGERPVNLAGWHLTDNFRAPRKWTFPPLELEAGGFVTVFASGKNRTNRTTDLHTNFRLDPKGEYLALIEPDGLGVAHEYLPKYPPMDADVSFGLRSTQFGAGGLAAMSRGLRRHAYFVASTPGRTNAQEMAGRVADTRFSHQRGTYSTPLEVVITTATPGAEIFFTTDGSTPRPDHGIRYDSPITIRTTTILRAAAFLQDYKPSDVDTQTYLFRSDVPDQTGEGFPKTWGVRNEAPVPADYEMDPETIRDPVVRKRVETSLASLPTLSLVLDRQDLFGADTGIYSNPLETGSAWERPASLEWLPLEGENPIHARCGVRIQGGWSRRPEESPKHSFRLEFRERYGNASLNHPLLGPAGPSRMKSLVLRAGCNNSWLHWSAEERRRGELLRDEFMRESLRALGHLTARGTFAHVYLDGLYWGIYNLCERPDADFLAQHLGGSPDDYDCRNAGKILSGTEEAWTRIFELANQGLEDPERYGEFSRRVDIDGFCRFMLVQIYGGTSDWDAASNWYAGRRTRPQGKYAFYLWDCERSLEAVDANILAADDDQSPTRLFQALRRNPRFRATFAEIARRELSAGGALSPEAAGRRYARLAEVLKPAIAAESARWGDYRQRVHSYREGPYERYTVEDHWQPEVNRLLERYFPARTEVVARQLRDAGLL
ncbi:MAG: CotH kinase family protein [Verrucomicrobiales bacterium]|nr:CotH kinase family protein [Verrucomicrobiales bacterium]